MYKIFDWRLVNITWPNQAVKSEEHQLKFIKYQQNNGAISSNALSLQATM